MIFGKLQVNMNVTVGMKRIVDVGSKGELIDVTWFSR